ncbi:CD209 antigen-like [Chelmon rostratus]|uniref:CD209 antigen-like n=1 Tax=Chelmon rostratus TaxID=109905 RepID=UPI001BE83030|nr:CD209 antigen-like [Chelmon rostratus]
MSEDLYAVPDLTKKVRFQTDKKQDGNSDVGDIGKVTIYDNCWAEGSTPQESQDYTTDVQQQTSSVNVSSGKRSLCRAAGVFLGLLCLALLAATIVLVALLIQHKNLWETDRNRLWVDNAKLTSERDELQTNNSEMESIIHNLTRKTSRLKDEKNLLQEINTNLTNERDELQKEIETTCCPGGWMKFGNSCYLFSTTKIAWKDSSEFCEEHDAQLVIISSKKEQKFLTLFNTQVWIGLTRDTSTGLWRWVNGTELYEEYWAAGQPDNNGPGGRSENCVEIGRNSKLRNWNDLECSSSRNFICEKVLQ